MIVIKTKSEAVVIDERNTVDVKFDKKSKDAWVRIVKPDGMEIFNYKGVVAVEYRPNTEAFTISIDDSCEQPETPQRQDGVLITRLADLTSFFSVRTMNVLRAADVNVVADFAKLTPDDVVKFRNSGKGTLAEVESFMQKFGLKWKGEQ